MSPLVFRLKSLESSLDLLPALGSLLPRAARDLALAEHMGMADAAVRHEAEQLAHGLERIADLRRMGRGSTALDAAEEKMAELARSLHRRVALAASKVESDILLDAEESLAGAVSTEIDVSGEFRRIAAVPAPISGEPRAVPTGFHASGAIGRVSGDFMSISMPCGEKSSAPLDAAILPEGLSLTFSPGETVSLHHQGMRAGDGSCVPLSAVFGTKLLQAGQGGMTIRGPAVLSGPGVPGVDLGVLADPTMEGIEHTGETKMLLHGTAMAVIVFFWAAIFSDVMPLAASDESIRVIPPLVATSALGVASGGVFFCEFFCFRRISAFRKRAAAALSFLRPGAAETSGAALAAFKEMEPARQTGLNVFPADYVLVQSAAGPKVIRPQAALPAPGSENVVALKDKVRA